MKLDAQHIAAGLALIALGFVLARRGAAASSASASAHNDIGGPADWWSYAGSWAV